MTALGANATQRLDAEFPKAPASVRRLQVTAAFGLAWDGGRFAAGMSAKQCRLGGLASWPVARPSFLRGNRHFHPYPRTIGHFRESGHRGTVEIAFQSLLRILHRS